MTVDDLINKAKVFWWHFRYPYKRPDEKVIRTFDVGYHLNLERRVSEGHKYWTLVTGKSNKQTRRLTLEDEELKSIYEVYQMGYKK